MRKLEIRNDILFWRRGDTLTKIRCCNSNEFPCTANCVKFEMMEQQQWDSKRDKLAIRGYYAQCHLFGLNNFGEIINPEAYEPQLKKPDSDWETQSNEPS